jgi:hypothetical protein
MTTRMQQRRGTSTQWTAANPTLAAGEIGLETNTGKSKIGDGQTAWNSLVYYTTSADLTSTTNTLTLSAASTLSTHNSTTTNVHGISDTSSLAYISQVNAAQAAAATDATTKANSAITTASADATTKANAAQAAAATDATTKANAAQAAAATDATTKANAAQAAAIAAAATDATTKVAAVTKASLGLSVVDNVQDANKPVSTAQAAAIATAKSEAITAAGSAADTKVSTHNTATANVHGIADTSALALTATVNSALALKAPLASPTFTGTVSGVTKAHVGLGNVDNTADADKPVSSATTTALGLKAPVASPTFTGTVTIPAGASISGFAPLTSPALTGTPTAPTAAAGTSTTQVATTAFVGTAVSNLVGSAPAALDTLNELATALGNDANFSTTLTTNLGLKAPKADPTFTGTVTVSASGVAFSDGTQTKAGVPSITNIPTALAAGAQTIGASRADQFIPLTGAVVITLPATGYSTGQSIDFFQESGTGAYFASTNSVVGTPGLKFRTTYSVATAMKTASGWLVFGDLSA